MSNHLDTLAVLNLLGRYANSFDLKRWDILQSCLADELYTDYSALRGTPPETMKASRFVELRKKALDPLKTHHQGFNPEVEITGDTGTARLSMAILRKNDDGTIFNTHCLYELGVTRAGGQWKISSLVQKVFWSDGDSKIHQGVVK
jgi:hypothetical protein